MKNLITVTVLLTFVGCATPSQVTSQDQGLAVTNTAIAPAAQGNVTTQQDENGNTQVSVSVKHMAKPNLMAANASAYVVWIKPVGQKSFQNVGALRVNNELEGTYQTSVPYQNFELIITPERSSMAQSPSGKTVLKKNVNL